MQLKIMIGFWFQPASVVMDHLVEHMPELAPERSEIEEFAKAMGLIHDDSQLFHALLIVEEDGAIRETTIIDKLGPATLRKGKLVKGKLFFVKQYLFRTDDISYAFEEVPDGFYVGGYDGRATGKGSARCYLFDPHPAFLASAEPLKW